MGDGLTLEKMRVNERLTSVENALIEATIISRSTAESMKNNIHDMSIVKEELVGIKQFLTKLSVQLENTNFNSSKIYTSIQNSIDKHNHDIYGNGSPGIKERLNKLEDDKDNRKKQATVLWGAIITALVYPIKLIWDWLLK